MPSHDADIPARANLYEMLQVSQRAEPEVIQAVYRVLARSYHPDVNGAPEAARRMREINAAYRVLSDPRRRARYDALRCRPARGRPARTTGSTSDAAWSTPEHVSPVAVARAHPRSGTANARATLAFMVLLASVSSSVVLALWFIFDSLG